MTGLWWNCVLYDHDGHCSFWRNISRLDTLFLVAANFECILLLWPLFVSHSHPKTGFLWGMNSSKTHHALKKTVQWHYNVFKIIIGNNYLKIIIVKLFRCICAISWKFKHNYRFKKYLATAGIFHCWHPSL